MMWQEMFARPYLLLLLLRLPLLLLLLLLLALLLLLLVVVVVQVVVVVRRCTVARLVGLVVRVRVRRLRLLRRRGGRHLRQELVVVRHPVGRRPTAHGGARPRPHRAAHLAHHHQHRVGVGVAPG